MNGIYAKKSIIENWLSEKSNNEIMFVSECEIKKDYLSEGCLDIPGYLLEVSNTINFKKSRICAYVDLNSEFRRNKGLEYDKNEILVFEKKKTSEIVIGIYRPFKCKESETKDSNFKRLLRNISDILDKNPMNQITLMGDFNIDYSKMDRRDYSNRKLAMQLNELTDNYQMTQLIKEYTRFRLVKNKDGIEKLQESLLDHIYVNYETKTR